MTSTSIGSGYGTELSTLALSLLSFVLFRTQPFIAYLCTASPVARTAKVAWLGLYVALFGLAVRLGLPPLEAAVGWLACAYFAGCSIAVYGMGELHRRRRIAPGGLFVACAALFFAAPAILVPDVAVPAFLILGWNGMLSSFSYCRDTAAVRERPALKDCVFFILVNPTVVYAERGVRCGPPAFSKSAMARVALGLLGLAACGCLSVVSSRWLAGRAPIYRNVFESGLLLYFTHSSVASTQIGAMRLLGHQIPERYSYPFLARSPAEFWRRWNTWVGRWVFRYMCRPLYVSRRGRVAPAAVAIFLSFVGVGALHDAYGYATELAAGRARASLAFTLAFAGFALALAAWSRAAAYLRSLAPMRALGSGVGTAIERVVFGLYLVGAAQWSTRSLLDASFSGVFGAVFPWLGWTAG